MGERGGGGGGEEGGDESLREKESIFQITHTIERNDSKLSLAEWHTSVSNHRIKTTFRVQLDMEDIVLFIQIWKDH